MALEDAQSISHLFWLHLNLCEWFDNSYRDQQSGWNQNGHSEYRRRLHTDRRSAGNTMALLHVSLQCVQALHIWHFLCNVISYARAFCRCPCGWGCVCCDSSCRTSSQWSSRSNTRCHSPVQSPSQVALSSPTPSHCPQTSLDSPAPPSSSAGVSLSPVSGVLSPLMPRVLSPPVPRVLPPVPGVSSWWHC